MNARSLARAALLLFVAASLGIWFARRDQPPTDQPVSAPPPPAAAAEVIKVLVTYFTTDVRCESCRQIEELSRRAVEEGFPAEVAAGRLVFRVVNTDRAEHEHFVDHYAITNKVVIVSRQEGGREAEWTRRQDVWLLLDDPEQFFAYVREPIRDYLLRG